MAQQNAAISVQNFETTLLIPSTIGLEFNTATWLSRWLARIPGPPALKRACFQAAMQLGLKQVDSLKLNYAFVRQRRRAVGNIFKDGKQQTLQLLFPGQDLGFVYIAGRLSNREKSATDQCNPLDFKPELKLGGRMPHFWLNDKDGRKISALDLPSLMIDTDRLPCYVMLIANKSDMAPKISAATKLRKSQPMVIIEITKRSELQSKTHFSYHHKRPVFLPPSFAVLIRPDGHIAWLYIPHNCTTNMTQIS